MKLLQNLIGDPLADKLHQFNHSKGHTLSAADYRRGPNLGIVVWVYT